MKQFFSELRRRAVIRAVVVYIGICWLLLQIIAVLATNIQINPLVGPAVLVLLSCGLPVVIYLAWFFKLSSSDPMPPLKPDDATWQPIKPPGRRHWAGLIVVVLAVGYIGAGYFSTVKQQQSARQQQAAAAKQPESIAVLPFTDQSPGKDQGYLALGLAEEITSLLGRARGFKVSASRSSQFLAEKGLTPLDIGRRLQVSTVLTGTVLASANRLQIRVQLLDIKTGETLWANSFSRNVTDVFAIENEIGRAVVNRLQDNLAAAGSFNTQASTSSADAYVLYLKGREQYRKQTTESMQQARQLFEQAVAVDPEYARGYVGLADTLLLLAKNSATFGLLDTDIAANLAQQNIEKALVRHPEMAEAYAVQGFIYNLQGHFEQAITEYDKATELNPSLAIAYMWKFLALNSLQRFHESILALEQAEQLDPLFQTNTYNLGWALTRAGRFDEAAAIFKQMKIDYPESTFSYQGLADLYFSQGNLVGAIRETKTASQLSPDDQRLAHKLISPMLNLGLADIVKQIATNPNLKSTVEQYQPAILILEKNFDGLFEQIDFSVAANPDDYWVQFEAGWYQSMYGDKQKALLLFTEKTNLIEQADMFGMPLCSPAIEIAWAQQELGNKEVALELINQCRNLLEQQLTSSIVYFELHYLAARIYALENDPEQAVQALAKAIDIGWREYWTKYDPLLASLADNPEFQQLIQFLDQDLARQKAEAQKLFTE